MSEPATLICVKTTAMPDPAVEGALPMPCSACGENVWVAPSGQKMIWRGEARAVCMEDARAMMVAADEEPEIQRPEWQSKELAGLSPAERKLILGGLRGWQQGIAEERRAKGKER